MAGEVDVQCLRHRPNCHLKPSFVVLRPDRRGTRLKAYSKTILVIVDAHNQERRPIDQLVELVLLLGIARGISKIAQATPQPPACGFFPLRFASYLQPSLTFVSSFSAADDLHA